MTTGGFVQLFLRLLFGQFNLHGKDRSHKNAGNTVGYFPLLRWLFGSVCLGQIQVMFDLMHFLRWSCNFYLLEPGEMRSIGLSV